jgi:hypothetical protein
MQISTDLAKGLEIIEPFLKQHDFKFKNQEDFKSSNSHFLLTRYQNDRKEFILGYHYSIGQVVYQFDDLAVSHDFYLDKLGFAKKKKFQDIQTNDKVLAFENLQHDFHFLVDDFFAGECARLKEIAQLHDNIIKEYDKKAREGYNIEFNKLRIDKARQEFRIKNFKKSLELYKSVETANLINDLYSRIIEFCESHN